MSSSTFVMRLRLAAALVPAIAGVAGAQIHRTGETTVACAVSGTCDANWAVQWFGLAGGVAPGANGVLTNAALISSIPSPPWAANVPGVQQWIGVTGNGITTTARTGDNAANYRYFFTTTVTNGASGFNLGMGWDNRLLGIFTGALTIGSDGSYSGGTSVFDVSPYAGKSGFCRDGDGVFPSSAFPSGCLLNATFNNVPSHSTLTVVLEGDGQTDGLLFGDARALGQSTATPEPASMVLLGSGLVGVAGFVRRRRRAA